MTNSQQTFLNGEKLKAFPLKPGTRQRVPTFTATIQHSFGSFGHSNQKVIEKEIKGIQIGKEDVKLSLFANDMILYLRCHQKITRADQ